MVEIGRTISLGKVCLLFVPRVFVLTLYDDSAILCGGTQNRIVCRSLIYVRLCDSFQMSHWNLIEKVFCGDLKRGCRQRYSSVIHQRNEFLQKPIYSR